MKRVLFILLTIVATVLTVDAKEAIPVVDPDETFVSAPDDVFPTLDTDTRMDMIDYYNCGYNRPSLDILEDSCMMIAKDSLSVTITIGKTQEHQLSMPTYKHIVLISTYSIPMEDSEIKFYDNEWKQQPTENFIILPTLDDWLTDEGAKNRIDVENIMPFIAAKYDFKAIDGELTITNSMNQYYDKDTWEQVKQWIRPCIKYKWTGKKFKKQ